MDISHNGSTNLNNSCQGQSRETLCPCCEPFRTSGLPQWRKKMLVEMKLWTDTAGFFKLKLNNLAQIIIPVH